MLMNNNALKGIVVAIKANYLIVELNRNIKGLNNNILKDKNKIVRLLCTKRNRLSYNGSFVSVGDFVLVESIDWNDLSAVISSIDKRDSYIDRPSIANFTDILVVISLEEPKFDPIQTTRFLLKAEQTKKNIHIILTKSDLIEPNILYKYTDRLKKWGYNSIVVSILSREGIDKLFEILKAVKIGVLCGPSGVGKSSLINHLFPQFSIQIGSLSKKLQRGRNTTRHVELYSLPNGGFIADTPGFNKPEFIFEPENLAEYFPELRFQLAQKICKFRNCLHVNEPGCAISRDWERYEVYKQYLDEMINSRL